MGGGSESRGTVISNDLIDHQQSGDALKHALAYAENIIATLREPFLVLKGELRVKTANRSFVESFHVSKEETENRLVYELGNGQWDIPLLRTLLNEVLSNSHLVHDFEVEHNFPDIGQRTMLLNARKFSREPNAPPLILLAIEDVTDRQLLFPKYLAADVQRAFVVFTSRRKVIGESAHAPQTAIRSSRAGVFVTKHFAFMSSARW
jgi:PAS domain-containing protein